MGDGCGAVFCKNKEYASSLTRALISCMPMPSSLTCALAKELPALVYQKIGYLCGHTQNSSDRFRGRVNSLCSFLHIIS